MKIQAIAKDLIPGPLWPLLRRATANMVYFGFKYRCPLCNARLRKLLNFGVSFPVLKELEVVGGGSREEAECPACGSSDRERLVYLYMEYVLGIRTRGCRLLHVAPEPSLSRRLARLSNLDYLTADISGQNVMVRMDITDIDFEDVYFDVIVCNHVLEHIIDDRQAMRELYRVLKPGGTAILQVPMSKRLNATLEDQTVVSEVDRERVFGQHNHVRIYAADYLDRLMSVGFEVDMFQWWTADERFGAATNRFRLLKDETLYVAQKPLTATSQ